MDVAEAGVVGRVACDVRRASDWRGLSSCL